MAYERLGKALHLAGHEAKGNDCIREAYQQYQNHGVRVKINIMSYLSELGSLDVLTYSGVDCIYVL